MAETFLLEIATPDRLILSDEVEMVTAPGSEGEFGVLAGHTDFLTILRAGELTYKKGGSEVTLVVSGGYTEVGPEKTTILVESATPVEEIDAAGARAGLKEAEARLAGLKEEDAGYHEALEKFNLAEALANAAEKKKGH